jgi:ABC-type nickel/cobalt efflux system permease component RcnA
MRRLIPFFAAIVVTAHPMGNFSVSHFTKFDVEKKSVHVTYVLDLAEIPTYQLMRDWSLDPAADAKIPQSTLDAKALAQAAEWIKQLDFTSGGTRLTPKLEGAQIKLSDGAGGMHVARVEAALRLDDVQGALAFEDKNYPDRAGWKEIVIGSADGTPIIEASQSGQDRSKALTAYPADPTLTPPQDLRANIQWHVDAPVIVTKIVPIEQPAPAATQAATAAPAAAPKPVAGEVTRGDYLSRMLSQHDIPFNIMLVGLAVAFAFGALHAKSPGHGKTMVAAYLVGSKGTMKQAAFLGGMVTLTHTISVFLLGLVTLAFAKYLAPEKLVTWVGIASGISIVLIGATLFYKRLKTLRAAKAPAHHHHHHHDHDHADAHAHAHGLAHTHDHHHDHEAHAHAHAHGLAHTHDHSHSHGFLEHDHGPNGHSHLPQGDVSLKSLIALGASGGMVPCPSALVLLLISISLGHVGLGLLLLVSFSLGLAGVLMAIGMMVIYAKKWLPDPVKTSQHPAFRLIPVLSAAVIFCIGLVMTGVSLGWIKPGTLLG